MKATKPKSKINDQIPVPLLAKVSCSDDGVKEKKSVTEGADSWYNPHNGTAVKLAIYENELNLTFSVPKNKYSSIPKRKKRDIKRFSRKSRYRVFKKFNRLQTKKLGKPLFITCTARNTEISPEQFEYAFLKLFLPKAKKIVPKMVYAWRLEFHESGFPHYHMFLWSFDKKRKLYSEYYKKRLRKAWRNAIEDQSNASVLYSCKIKTCSTERKVFSYVSKYTAKEEGHEHAEKTGRRWGISTNFPANPITEINISKKKANKLLEMMKQLALSSGRDPEKVEEFMNNSGQTFAWMPLMDIYKMLREAGIPIVTDQVNFYIRTGEITPTDAYFEHYAQFEG